MPLAFEARGSVGDFIHSRGHCGSERVEAALGNRVEQRLLIGKMMIGRRRRDTRAAGNGTQRQCREAVVFQDFLRRRDQRVAQAAVMIRRIPLVGPCRSTKIGFVTHFKPLQPVQADNDLDIV